MPDLRPRADWPQGKIIPLMHRSEVLRGNPWNDPTERTVSVYLPPGYDEAGEAYPVLWDLAAYTSAGPAHLSWRNQGENLPQRLDRLIAEGALDPVIVVLPDCYTSLGGNQYLNSPAVGQYSDYLCTELLPFVEQQVNAIPHRSGRALFGKSSGGYGALVLAMQYPELWGAAASHAGDVGFDRVYLKDFPITATVLADYGGDIQAFMRAFWRKKRPNGRDYTAMMILAMAASYDPDASEPSNIRLPFDMRSCELDEKRWTRWLAWDPLNMVARHREALHSLHGLYLDVGRYDQYHIQFGSRQLSDRLGSLGIAHYFEEFDGTHSGIDWRLDLSLPWLVRALKNTPGEQNDA